MRNTICDENKCTACGACLNICPKKCVFYKKDGVGHLYPVIDERKSNNVNKTHLKLQSNSLV